MQPQPAVCWAWQPLHASSTCGGGKSCGGLAGTGCTLPCLGTLSLPHSTALFEENHVSTQKCDVAKQVWGQWECRTPSPPETNCGSLQGCKDLSRRSIKARIPEFQNNGRGNSGSKDRNSRKMRAVHAHVMQVDPRSEQLALRRRLDGYLRFTREQTSLYGTPPQLKHFRKNHLEEGCWIKRKRERHRFSWFPGFLVSFYDSGKGSHELGHASSFQCTSGGDNFAGAPRGGGTLRLLGRQLPPPPPPPPLGPPANS